MRKALFQLTLILAFLLGPALICQAAPVTNAPVVLEKTLDEALKQGEIEGLCMDPSNGDLLVLMNRGAHIVLGMNKGLYPGYDKEISEVYRYSMTPKGKGPAPRT